MNHHSSVRHRVWQIVSPAKPGDMQSRRFDLFMSTLIALNVLAVMVGTVESVSEGWGPALDAFEVLSVAIFSIEYVVTLWASTADSRYSAPLVGRLRYASSPLALFDLAAIAPFFIGLAMVDLRFMRVFRLLRSLRLLKSARYSSALRTLGRVVRSEREMLAGILIVMFIVLIMASSLMYLVERDVQPGAFSSIPQTMWWGVSALLKVRLVDMQPVTVAGRLLGSFLALWGVALVALPAGVIGSGFVREFRSRGEPAFIRCPHCGGAVSPREPA